MARDPRSKIQSGSFRSRDLARPLGSLPHLRFPERCRWNLTAPVWEE